MEAFQKRMVNEFEELRDKVNKLDDFIYNNPMFDKLDKKVKCLQVKRLTGMKIYLSALIDILEHRGISVIEKE